MIQLGYSLETALGRSNYRLIFTKSDAQFLNPARTSKERAFAGGLSFDQELRDDVGAFVRLAWHPEDRSVDYNVLYSGGLDCKGSAWGG